MLILCHILQGVWKFAATTFSWTWVHMVVFVLGCFYIYQLILFSLNSFYTVVRFFLFFFLFVFCFVFWFVLFCFVLFFVCLFVFFGLLVCLFVCLFWFCFVLCCFVFVVLWGFSWEDNFRTINIFFYFLECRIFKGCVKKYS